MSATRLAGRRERAYATCLFEAEPEKSRHYFVFLGLSVSLFLLLVGKDVVPGHCVGKSDKTFSFERREHFVSFLVINLFLDLRTY